MTAFQQLPSSVLQTRLFFSPSVSLDSQTVSAKEYLFPYQKERLKPFRQVKEILQTSCSSCLIL
ncbi:ABC transporter substrate-binding protein [Streptococcus pneumoniae]|nr:ABC transporter substrate-binding protein [Streptococcus pneumoniae]